MMFVLGKSKTSSLLNPNGVNSPNNSKETSPNIHGSEEIR